MSFPEKRTAVITGGTGGLGLALAAKLVERDHHVFLLDLDGTPVETLPLAASNNITFIECDVTDEKAVTGATQTILEQAPAIDLVVYNAGITQIGEVTEGETRAHRLVFDVNYFGALYLLRHMVPAVRRAKGTHLAISSVAGFAPLCKRTAYSASKHALEGLFKSLRAEEMDHGVTVSIASPSFVATNIGNPQHREGGIARPGSAEDGVDYMSPEAAAGEIVRGLDRKSVYIPVGRVARLAWYINRFLPETYFRMMIKRIKTGNK